MAERIEIGYPARAAPKVQAPSQRLYLSGGYLDRNPTWHSEDSRWKANQILKILARNAIRPESVCDIGCGAGEVLRCLHEMLPRHIMFDGYEVSPQAFEICKVKTRDRLAFHLKDILKEKGSYFDLVLCIDVLEHVEDYYTFLRKIKDKGTYKLFHIPLDVSIQGILRGHLLRERRDVGHLHYFTKDVAIEMLKYADYDLMDSCYTAPSLRFPAKSLRKRIGRLPQKLLFKVNKDMAALVWGGYSLLVLTR